MKTLVPKYRPIILTGKKVSVFIVDTDFIFVSLLILVCHKSIGVTKIICNRKQTKNDLEFAMYIYEKFTAFQKLTFENIYIKKIELTQQKLKPLFAMQLFSE